MEDRTLDVLKWIGLAFAAGFIGYFGRYLSMAIIDKVKKRKNPAERIAVPSYEQTTREDTNSLRDSKIAKLEKKRIKNRVKQAKKNLKE